MKFCDKKELLNALLNIEGMLPNLDNSKCNPLKSIVLFFDVECDFYKADRSSIKKIEKIDCLYKIWAESRMCEKLADEMAILSCLDDLLKLLDISFDSFDKFLDCIEGEVEV